MWIYVKEIKIYIIFKYLSENILTIYVDKYLKTRTKIDIQSM